MSGISWGNGYAQFGEQDGPVVRYFENNGVVWYDDRVGIALDGWQKELEPYCGPGWTGAPFRRRVDRWLEVIRAFAIKLTNGSKYPTNGKK